MERLTVTIGVLTYKRPEELALGLPLMLEQARALGTDLNADVTAEVLVIDNDPEGSAEYVVRALDGPDVRYALEAEPGIAAARNRAIDAAGQADLLIFIDDDERPRPGWLAPLVRTWRETGATAVMGRVISEFDGPLHPWVAAGDFFLRPSMPTGTPIQVAAAGNLLLDLQEVRVSGVRFDHRLGLTGGEDTLFSRQLTAYGARIVWCDESQATDHVPRSRMTRRWVLTRCWSHGNTTSTVGIYMAHGVGSRLAARIGSTLQGLARMAAGSGRFALGLVSRSKRHQARGLRTAFRGAGMVSGAFGHRYAEYARSDP